MFEPLTETEQERIKTIRARVANWDSDSEGYGFVVDLLAFVAKQETALAHLAARADRHRKQSDDHVKYWLAAKEEIQQLKKDMAFLAGRHAASNSCVTWLVEKLADYEATVKDYPKVIFNVNSARVERPEAPQ